MKRKPICLAANLKNFFSHNVLFKMFVIMRKNKIKKYSAGGLCKKPIYELMILKFDELKKKICLYMKEKGNI